MSQRDINQIIKFEQDLKKMKANGDWPVNVMGVSEDSPAGFSIDGEAMSVRVDWMPKYMHSFLVLKKEDCQRAVDGDALLQSYIEAQAKRSVIRGLIADLKKAYGPDWVLKVVVEREDKKAEQ